jgi:hypothetical protein
LPQHIHGNLCDAAVLRRISAAPVVAQELAPRSVIAPQTLDRRLRAT